uniref:PAS domain-containing protein n=1 Tax=Desertifilum tharense IPPAS B-1220 TaxID=1781255 RepID=A0ACD5GY78_9CYAN
MVRDSLGEFTYLSPVCQEVFELDPQAVLDNASLMWQVVHPEDISGFRESILQVVQSYWETGTTLRSATAMALGMANYYPFWSVEMDTRHCPCGGTAGWDFVVGWFAFRY